MRNWFLVLAAITGLAIGSWAQSTAKRSETDDEKTPNVTVVSVTFEDVTQISTAQQESIASDLKSRMYHGPDWLDEVNERVRYAWQQRGFFSAKSHSNAHQRNSDMRDQEMEVTASVEERSTSSRSSNSMARLRSRTSN